MKVRCAEELRLKAEIVHVHDVLVDPEYTQLEAQKLGGYRTVLGVPLMREGNPIGCMFLARAEVAPFNDKQIELLTTFADQAVIAIENVRLFDEVQARTRELSDSLQQQTATSEVLEVISSSPGELEPVFNSMLKNAVTICGAQFGNLFLIDSDGARWEAGVGTPPKLVEYFTQSRSFRPTPGSHLDRVMRTKQVSHTADDAAEVVIGAAARLGGARSTVCVPMVKDEALVGAIFIYRTEMLPFTDKQIKLVQNFAAQAVIAIENTRLLNELRESLTQQTATADVLKVISRSTFDLQAVLDTLVESASKLCESHDALILLRQGDRLQVKAHSGPILMDVQDWPIERDYVAGRAFVDRVALHVDDVQTSDDFPSGREVALRVGHRTLLAIPLLREDEAIGVISLRRSDVKPFTEKQIDLVTTFADQAVIAIENTRLFNEVKARTEDLSEALQQQTATADVLKVISSSPGELEPVFQAMLENATRVCGGEFGSMVLVESGTVRRAALYNVPPAFAAMRTNEVWQVHPRSSMATAISSKQVVQVEDMRSGPAYLERSPMSVQLVELGGARTVVVVPMLREDEVIGLITVYRQEVRPFTDKQIELLNNFARQAVIAIENTRLLKELRESLQQQTATADVLKAISRSTFDLQTVLQTLVESAATLCEADKATITRQKDGVFFRAESYGFSNEFVNYIRTVPVVPERGSAGGRALLEGVVIHIPDVQADAEYALTEAQRLGGFRTMLSVPMLREGVPIGVIGLTRSEVRPFNDKQIELATTFADQAAIAIENARLFDEVQAKTRDLSQALTYQTGSSNVLSVIASSPTDVGPVLKAIAESACELCEAYDAVVRLKNGDELQIRAHHGPIPIDAPKLLINRNWTAGRAVLDKKPVHVHDMQSAEGDEFLEAQERARHQGHRTVLSVPLLREGESIGAIILRRIEVHPFSEKQIALLQTFADQAVIAIENTRLFNETKEALERQTATADVLNVISRSPTDAAPVFDIIGERAEKLCNAEISVVSVLDGDLIRVAGIRGITRDNVELFRAHFPMPLDRKTVTARTIKTGAVVHISDVLVDTTYDNKVLAEQTGYRSCLGVPMHREGQVVGAIFVARTEPDRFSDNQIRLLEIFADQAVIAIGNVRLFEEVQAKTRDLTESLQQQTATADVLKVISASPGELEPVFQAMLENAVRLCDAKFAMLILYDKDKNEFRGVSKWNLPPAYSEFLGKNPIRPDPKIPLGRVAITKQPVQIADVLMDQSYIERFPGIVGVAELGGARTLLQVPMLKENELVGTIGIYRQEVRPFTDKQIALVKNFAAQAVIAIENARLLNELRQRTDDLTESLEDLRTAQDRLVQTEKLASLGQLTAGIAHEIKNPLNFVNNFSALSAELTDELNDLLKSATLTDKMREEVEDLTRLLKENLDKVVQHGQRADSIVKNMLLHSRQGSGEHRRVEINVLVEETLNLAYHGARAEKPGFNITLKRSLDPNAGEIEVFPQEITRVLLNLISNGFYAATKRNAQVDGDDYEPTLAAATKNLGDSVEIRIRDSGSGIPPEVREKMFNPFFTTKPAGEGTGLGLSLSHDIVVKQHGGSIEVDTQPGEFTEFKVILPRMAATGKAGADK